MNNNIERARNKSCNGKKVKKGNEEVTVTRLFLKQATAIIVVAGMVVGSGLTFGAGKLKDEMNNYLNSSSYVVSNNVVRSNTHRTNDNLHYYYDNNEIANDIIESNNDIDSMIYSTYENMEYDRVSNMNEVLTALSNKIDDKKYQDYSDFNDYLRKNNFVDKEGNIDIDKYEQYMEEYITMLNERKEVNK